MASDVLHFYSFFAQTFNEMCYILANSVNCSTLALRSQYVLYIQRNFCFQMFYLRLPDLLYNSNNYHGCSKGVKTMLFTFTRYTPTFFTDMVCTYIFVTSMV